MGNFPSASCLIIRLWSASLTASKTCIHSSNIAGKNPYTPFLYPWMDQWTWNTPRKIEHVTWTSQIGTGKHIFQTLNFFRFKMFVFRQPIPKQWIVPLWFHQMRHVQNPYDIPLCCLLYSKDPCFMAYYNPYITNSQGSLFVQCSTVQRLPCHQPKQAISKFSGHPRCPPRHTYQSCEQKNAEFFSSRWPIYVRAKLLDFFKSHIPEKQ